MRTLGLVGLVLLSSLSLLAQERRVIGLSESGQEIELWEVPDDVSRAIQTGTAADRLIVLVAGLNGEDESSAEALRLFRELESGTSWSGSSRWGIIPVANPSKVSLQFPPAGAAYRENTEAHFLWRWLGIHAPDVVVIIGADPGGLGAALKTKQVAEVGTIGLRELAVGESLRVALGGVPPSGAHIELEQRRERSAGQLADELADVFGHDFDQLTYLPGMALIGQLRMGNVEEVAALAEPYLDPERDLLARASSLTLAGHLVFAELAERLPDGETRDRYIELVKRVAELGFDESGAMRESMPFHNEMSDSYFMAGPIVAKAGKFAGDRKYFDLAAQHFRYLQQLTLRDDGLHRHSPLTDAAWGRGNAFPALGLALTLSDFPEDHPDYEFILKSFQDHMAALAPYQDQDGMWHNVIDIPGSYAETSATSMITTAMIRGVRNGWLDADEYQPRIDRAWKALLARISSTGELIDVCESTNKQPTLEDYMNREALLGRDPRGGGMALILATEMAGLN